MYYRVWVASQRFHGKKLLTYSSEVKLARGQLVTVPLQRSLVLGIIDSPDQKPDFATKTIASSWTITIPESAMKLMLWLKDYYPSSQGVIAELFTPPALTKKIMYDPVIWDQPSLKSLPDLTAEQAETVRQIASNPARSVLLHGDTGSGKTRVYIELIVQTLKSDRSAIILTPEIGLSEQLRNTLTDTFGNRVIVTHSEMTPSQRRQAWLKVCSANHPVIVIGPRSAVFVPASNIGLIVMDEAHDSAYKQEQAPYYQTSRVAAQLARIHNAHFIMGTATPLIADYFSFQQKNLHIIRMSQQAMPIKTKTLSLVLDHREKSLFNRSQWLSDPLLAAIDDSLLRKEQALLFLNRRGSARLVLCKSCGWQALCPHCDVALTYHQDQHLMRCHSCNFSDRTPDTCPQCDETELIFRSIGTKALESEISRLYPNANIARFDRDTQKSLNLTALYSDLVSGKVNILIGTQSIAKGFDLPKLSVVGIVQADSGLQIPDYTSNEKTFQLISQVSGRIGRGHVPGKLFIQSFQPNSPLIKQSLTKDYQEFYKNELLKRELYKFPPYFFLLKVTCSRASSSSALAACSKIAYEIKKRYPGLLIEGPTPRFIEKISGRYAWHLVIKSQHRSNLLKVISTLPANCTYDIDPSELL